MASEALSPSVKPLTFQILDKIEGQFCKEEAVVRLLHFWEARNFNKGNVLMVIQVLLLHSEFRDSSRRTASSRHEDNLNCNSVYKLKKFMVRPAKTLYMVSDYKHTICFTYLTTMDPVVVDGEANIDAQKFRIRVFNDFAPIADGDFDMFDVIGQLR
uniref:DUF223 domain-containing protein n=1 Tax=Noccaea caerulescens TaxID=107243 RepID=A0A1J3GY13_NOCCA